MLMEVTGAEAVASALTTNVTSANLYQEIVPYIPFVATMIVFAFGMRFLLKRMKNAPKMKP